MAATMDQGLKKQLETFHREVAKQGEDIVYRIFPTKLWQIFDLNELLKSVEDSSSPFHPSHSSGMTDATVYPPPASSLEDATGRKRKRLDNGEKPVVDGTETIQQAQNAPSTSPKYLEHVKGNYLITHTIHKRLKEECEELAGLMDKARLWVAMTLPKIEDGDNFGVGVQEEVLGELQRAQEAAFNLRDIPQKDHLTRAKICSKLIKYPNVEDYTIALKEHDQKQFFLARQHLTDIRNIYATLTDMIHKNIDKIRKPKANNSMNLY
ncbi:proteasome activator pa28, REG alpha/beta subunit [Coprinellus micaceus]|uniref:Proteasome activator pa28, REG alpha/beta subunit n=1 Tax=Coprinellus micaceus TaxID=71717 RepID=A0A4Y7TZG8_COPMI|nr:proteasome activator pa28, REG alpha/beta subunit [Coprinellus micaceus]